MPTYQFEAMDAAGNVIKDVIDQPSEEEALSTIRQNGYFITKISVKKIRKTAAEKKKGAKGGKTFALGGVSSKNLTTFTRQLSILQDAGLPILRSLRILEGQQKGGALEVILQRLAEFQEKSQRLKRKVIGAMVYPCVVIGVAVLILTGIMIWIVPEFVSIFDDFDAELPVMTVMLMTMSDAVVHWWFLLPGIPIGIWLFVKLIRKFQAGRAGWDLFILKIPVFGQIIEKNIVARTTRTLGTLVSSGVPILEAINITRETSGNHMFENMYGKVYESIREGESIARPMKEHSRPKFNLITLFFWTVFMPPILGALFYLTKLSQRVIDDLVVNMVDVGEETGELDTMLYKVADTYDEIVAVLTESLLSLLEPLMIVVLGAIVGFIVVSLFLPLVGLIEKLSG